MLLQGLELLVTVMLARNRLPQPAAAAGGPFAAELISLPSGLLSMVCEAIVDTSADAWQIFRSDALHDVWKLEQDARDPSRYFVNQFIAANASPENGADGGSAPA